MESSQNLAIMNLCGIIKLCPHSEAIKNQHNPFISTVKLTFCTGNVLSEICQKCQNQKEFSSIFLGLIGFILLKVTSFYELQLTSLDERLTFLLLTTVFN